MNSNQKNNIVTLCRIKVNKMLSSLNTNNQNIFVPKYTIAKKTESNYNSNLNTNNKQVKKVDNNKKRIFKKNILKNKDENRPIDFIINHGVLIYQRNMQGEEIINYGINKNNNKIIKSKNINNKSGKILYRTGSNYNKNRIKTDNSKKSINTTRTTFDISLASKNDNLNKHFLWSNTLDNYYNKQNIENSFINSNINNNIINNNSNTNKTILKKNNTNYLLRKYKKNKPQTKSEINNKIIYLTKILKNIFSKKLKNIFLFLKFYFQQNNENKADINKNISIKQELKNQINKIIIHKKTDSIVVNKRFSSNLTNLISKNFKFFTKEKEEPELYRDSKSLEKKYEQICRRKKLNLTMTSIGKFRQKEDNLNENNNNYLSERNTYNSFSSFTYNNNIKNIMSNKKYYKNSTSLINNSVNNEISAITDSINSITENYNYKIKSIENNKKDKNIFSYRIDKNQIIRNENTSYNFSNSYSTFKDESLNNYEVIRKKITLYKNYFKREKNTSNTKVKKFLEKRKNNINENKFYIIKDIITKDKRLYIRINYLPLISFENKNTNRKIKLNISKIFDFSYIQINKIRKRFNKRKNELKQKLSLIKEEEEKNSSIKLLDKRNNNSKIIKISVIKLANVIEKNIYLRKYEFFFKLNKSIKKQKKIELGENICDFIVKEKKFFLNNNFLNNDKNLFNSRSLNFLKEFSIIDSSSSSLRKPKKGSYSRDNINFKNK